MVVTVVYLCFDFKTNLFFLTDLKMYRVANRKYHTTHNNNYNYHIIILHFLSVQIVESVVKKYEEGSTKAIEDMTLDELEEVEDDADEAVLLQYRYSSIM